MAGSERSLLIKFIGESKSLEDASAQADKAIGGVGLSLGKLAQGAAFAKVTQEMIGFAKDSVGAALEDKQAQEQLALALRNSVGATKEQIAAVEESIGKLQAQTGVLDDELRPAFSTLIRATKDTEAATRIMTIANDVAVGKGKDLGAVSDALAKAYQGNTKGLKDLGVELKNADGSAKSFNEISQELVTLYGGAAKTAFDADPAKQLRVQLENLKETVGNALLPVVTSLAGVATQVLGVFNDLSPATQKLIVYVGLLGGAGMSAVKSFNSFSKALDGIGISGSAAGLAMGAAGLAMTGFALRAQGAEDASKSLATHIENLNRAADKDVLGEFGLALGRLSMKGYSFGESVAYMAKENLEGTKRFLELAEASGLYEGKLQPVIDAIAEEERARRQATATLEAHTAAVEEAVPTEEELKLAEQERTKAIEAQRQRLEDAEKAERALIDARLASIDSTYAVRDAEDRLAEAFAAVKADDPATVVDEFRQSNDDAAQAALALAIAVRDNAVAMAESAGAPMDAAAANQVLIDSLHQTVLSLGPDSPVRQALIDHIATLQGVPATKSTKVTVTGTGPAKADLGDVAAAADKVKAETKTDSKADTAVAKTALDELTVAAEGVPTDIKMAIGVPDVDPAISALDRLARKLDEVQRKADKLEGTMRRVAG